MKATRFHTFLSSCLKAGGAWLFLNLSFLWELFARREITYNLRIKDLALLTMSFGINSISFRGSILWNSTPDVIKSSNAVFTFITKLKTGLVKFAIVIFVQSFITLCSCSFFG